VAPWKNPKPCGYVEPSGRYLGRSSPSVFDHHLTPLAVVCELIQALDLHAATSAADRCDVADVAARAKTTAIANPGDGKKREWASKGQLLAPLSPQLDEGVHGVGDDLLDGLLAVFRPRTAETESRLAADVGQQFQEFSVPIGRVLGGSLGLRR